MINEMQREYHKMKKIDWIVSLRAMAAMAIVLLHVVSTWVEGSGGGYYKDFG